MVILLIYFTLLLLILLVRKNKSVALMFILLQIISLAGGFLIGVDYPVDTITKALNLVFTGFVLSSLIIPWLKINGIKEITVSNELKIKRITYGLILISVPPFFTFLVVSIFVMLYVDNISEFKYAEGVSVDFYYNLPINIKLFILSNYLYNFSFFLIPLHFYYLSRRKFLLAFLCFLFSLNSILYGLTYFSRSVFIHYIFIYAAFYMMLYTTLDKRFKNFIKVGTIVLVTVFVSYFIYISEERFSSDTVYENTIPNDSIVKNPITYSYFDYLSQWYTNNMQILESYQYETFNGQISLQPVLSLMGQYGIINYSSDAYSDLRKKLWPEHWFLFNGFVAYSVYDYGYLLTIFIMGLYYFVIRINAPKNGQISILSLFLFSLLVQLPLMAIFYSNVGGVLIPLILLIPIFLYLKISVKRQL